MTTKSQQFPVQQVKMSHAEVLRRIVSEMDEDNNEEMEGGYDTESNMFPGFSVNSGEVTPLRALTEELHDMSYQLMLQREYENQSMQPEREVNLARPHEYHVMVKHVLVERSGSKNIRCL